MLGKTTLKGAEARTLVEAFDGGVREFQGGPARCFSPRHGIRAVHDGKTADFIICFECAQVRVNVDGKEAQGFLISDSPATVFNALLTKAGVALPKPPAGLPSP